MTGEVAESPASTTPASRRAVFASAELDRAFARDGYVVIRQLCDPAAVDRLVESYARLGPAPGDDREYCHFDFQSADRSYKRSTDQAIRSVLDEAVREQFVRFRPYYGNFVMKWPSPTSWFGVHQDSGFVDESVAVSASIWVATTEVDEENGAVWFFPGSHRMRSTLRGSNQKQFAFQEVAAEVEERCGKIVRLAPGDAIVFDHRVVHWSYANFSDSPRLAAVLGVIPEEAALVHHRASDDGTEIETFEIDDAFFIDNDPFGSLLQGLSSYPSRGISPLDVDPVTPEELDAWLEQHPVSADDEVAADLRARTASAVAVGVAASDNGGRGAAGPLPSGVIDQVALGEDPAPSPADPVADAEVPDRDESSNLPEVSPPASASPSAPAAPLRRGPLRRIARGIRAVWRGRR